MIIQVILTSGLFLSIFYAQVASVGYSKNPIILFSLIGIYLVWQPNQANMIANYLGIGRGADMIMYFFIIFMIIVNINLNAKIRKLLFMITEVVRNDAIEEAQKNSANNPRLRKE